MPRREIGAGVEQIAGHVDLLARLRVGQTLRRRLAMGLAGNDGRRHHRGERPNETAICHQSSLWLRKFVTGFDRW